MNDKVEILVTEGHNFVPEVHFGEAYTSVDYSAKLYGGASPCRMELEVQKAIKSAEKTIINHEDIPIIVDKREKNLLTSWC